MQIRVTPFSINSKTILFHSHAPFSCEEVQFWESVRCSLLRHQYELIKIGYVNSYSCSQRNANIPFISIPDGLDNPLHFWNIRKIPLHENSQTRLDYQDLLNRESIWRNLDSQTFSLEQQSNRIKSINFWHSFYSIILHSAKPVLTILWNGQHPQEMILEDLCRRSGCPIIYAERSFIPNSIHLDIEGILAGTKTSQLSSWHWEDGSPKDLWIKTAENISATGNRKDKNWWWQPTSVGQDRIRKELNIPSDVRIVLFAGQVDQDTQNFLFSPFYSNLEAFKWFCYRLQEMNDKKVFVLGKHHPKSPMPAEAYGAILTESSLQGVWTSKFSISDCLALAHRVAAVNSTVIYEALMSQKPVLTLGKLILSNKDIAYEVDLANPDSIHRQFKDWLDAADFESRYEKWKDFLAYLLSLDIFTVDKQMYDMGMLGSNDLAEYLMSHQEAGRSHGLEPDYSQLEIRDIDFLGILEWKQAEADYWQQQVEGIFRSRFWQLREKWFALKRLLRITKEQ